MPSEISIRYMRSDCLLSCGIRQLATLPLIFVTRFRPYYSSTVSVGQGKERGERRRGSIRKVGYWTLRRGKKSDTLLLSRLRCFFFVGQRTESLFILLFFCLGCSCNKFRSPFFGREVRERRGPSSAIIFLN